MPLVATLAVLAFPVVMAVDALVRPASAWARVSRRRAFWVAAPLAMTAGSWVVSSFWPSVVAIAVAAYYTARVRPVVSVAQGMERPSRALPAADLGELWLAAGALVLFAVFVAATATTARERVIGAAIFLAGVALVAGTGVWLARRR